MPCGDTSEKWSSCYNKLTRPPRSGDGDVLTPHYQRFLPSLVLVSTANTLSLAADNKKKGDKSLCLTAEWKPRKDCHRPESWASPQGGTCDSCQMCRQLLLPPSLSFLPPLSLSQKLFQFLKWILRQIEADFCFLFFFSSPTLPSNLSGLIWEAVLLIFAVLRSCCSHQWNSPLIWPPKRKLLIWTMKTQIGINSQKRSEYFCASFHPGQIQTKSPVLLLPIVTSRSHALAQKHLVFTNIFGRKKYKLCADKSCNVCST